MQEPSKRLQDTERRAVLGNHQIEANLPIAEASRPSLLLLGLSITRRPLLSNPSASFMPRHEGMLCNRLFANDFFCQSRFHNRFTPNISIWLNQLTCISFPG